MSVRPEELAVSRGERGEPFGGTLDRLRRELLRSDFLYDHPQDFRAGVEETCRGLARVLDPGVGGSGEAMSLRSRSSDPKPGSDTVPQS